MPWLGNRQGFVYKPCTAFVRRTPRLFRPRPRGVRHPALPGTVTRGHHYIRENSMFSALLFPGQGSQETGMARELAEADSDVMDLWKKAERISGIALREIYWDGDATAMADTRNLQPGLTAANLACWMKLAPRFTPAAAAGHSLGEFSALAAAGVLPIDTVLELVSLRGRLMSEADPEGKGAMAAVVKLGLDEVQACVTEAADATGEMIGIANYNTPGQFVISGTRAAIEDAQGRAKAAKGRAIPLAVSGAFHSPMMRDAATELASAIDAIGKNAWSKARFPVYCNVEPVPAQDPDRIREQLKRQMTSSVFWIDTITRQWDDSCRLFVECGPKNVLSKMVDPILKAHAPAAATHTEDAPAWRAASVSGLEQIESFGV